MTTKLQVVPKAKVQLKGVLGFKGERGAEGPRGPIGPEGPQGTPGPAGAIATQADAEAGSNVVDYMNPLRTKQSIVENGAEGLYSRDGGLTRRPLKYLRRDWTTLFEMGAADDPTVNSWPALQKALASGLKIDGEGREYRIDPNGVSGGGFTVPATTPLITNATFKRSTSGGIYMTIDGDANGKSAKLQNVKLIGPWTRDKATVSGDYGIYAQKTVWRSGTDADLYWFYGMDWDGVEVEGFGARGFNVTMASDCNFRRLVAKNCGTHGFLGQAVVSSYLNGLSDGIGELSAAMAENRYGFSLARPSVFSNTGVLATCPVPQDCTVNWEVKNLEMYFAFDCHSGRRITFRDCVTANVGTGFNIEHANQTDEANCEDITIEGGQFFGLTTITSTRKPGPLLFVDSAVAGKTQKARNISIKNVAPQGFGFMGSNIDGPNGAWGGVIAAQGVDGLTIEDVEITSGYGPGVLLYTPTDGSETFRCSNVKIDGLRYYNPVNPANYPGGDPGGSWKDPYLVQVDTAEVSLSIANSSIVGGSYCGFMAIDHTPGTGSRIHVGENNRTREFVAGSGNKPVFYKSGDAVKVSSGSGSPLGSRGKGWIPISGGAIAAGATLPPGWTASYVAVGTYDITVPAGTYEYASLPVVAVGAGPGVDRMLSTTQSATVIRIFTYNSASTQVLFDPTQFWFELWGPPGNQGT